MSHIITLEVLYFISILIPMKWYFIILWITMKIEIIYPTKIYWTCSFLYQNIGEYWIEFDYKLGGNESVFFS